MTGRKSAIGSWSTTCLCPKSMTSGSGCLLLDKIFLYVGLDELSQPQHNDLISTRSSTASRKELLREMSCIFSKAKVN